MAQDPSIAPKYRIRLEPSGFKDKLSGYQGGSTLYIESDEYGMSLDLWRILVNDLTSRGFKAYIEERHTSLWKDK